jgi:hypothetical protein
VHDARDRGQPPDDWFGDISEQDWNEDETDFAEEHRATPARHERSTAETYPERDVQTAAAPSVATTEARRADVRRRRAVAAVVLLLLIALAATAAVLLLRDGSEPTATTESEPPAVTTPTETGTVTTPPPPTPTPPTPTPPPPPAGSGTITTFTLPEGVKLQRDPSAADTWSDLTVSTDPELIADLQRALEAAGYDPGSPDGTFGENTEAAVIAFQQANGLTPDGIVGPTTAEALNTALARG